ncbi:PqqD family peptide modification chaperone [Mucilaginibacter ginsenosidivorax]|jgi:hypothetical protein|uniref:PqqD family peptide modification chaperone n=1 Tax=Mucilaginibacter ginsenosidivorax TaxID=862126 RepID=A0A5B8W7Z5_9SPHI|nr:PqqD family peptide modification chaperone [Mucilaginibacter ginsenosidivorax]QEC79883.1 PqqD family peptide modification chaperone [Mucilaginibacter ginsenosidivorax]
MKIKSNIATSENGFIFNPATGDSFSGNAIAALLLLAMKSGKTESEIKQDILNRYNVSERQLDLDWEDWMVQLKEANLLETEG